ncbi:Imm1 family immunity protein [Kribbella sp. NPDC059898]|uniref:Imm1 family immunity protein n=1 Tax=Kribbella sp. NPDC059898 TaxID=3346995 RepID=UPI003661A685
MTYTIAAYYKHGHGQDPVIISTPEQVDELVDALLAESFDNTVAALYIRERHKTGKGRPDHELRVGVGPERKLGSVRYAGVVDEQRGAWYIGGQPIRHDEVYYEYMGSPQDFPADAEVPLDVVRQVIQEFLASGTRPPSAQWKVLTSRSS